MKTLFIKLFVSLGFILSLYTLNVQTVMAHGEKALEPFIRMRTIQWYDVHWSKQKFNVNEEITVSGRFHVAEDWPISVPKPEASFLNISTPGPVLIRTERYLNGKPWINSVALQTGGDYDFKIVLKGRLPGHYHIHPFFNLKDAGQVMGPGAWLDIEGNPADFSNDIKTINGETIDMETYGLSNGILWHLFWGALATAWLLWWVRRPLFIARYRMLQAGMETYGLSNGILWHLFWGALATAWLLWWVRRPLFIVRYRMLQAGMEDELITRKDRLIAKVILVGVPVLVLTANAMTINNYPNTIPLQASLDQILPLSAQVNAGVVDVETLKAEYQVTKRAMTFTIKINNRSDKSIQIGEFSTANVRFINKDLNTQHQGFANSVVALEGLSLDNAEPIKPKEQRTMTITASDALWESEQLDGLIRDADSRIGGLLFFYDDLLGERYISSISAAVIPKFN